MIHVLESAATRENQIPQQHFLHWHPDPAAPAEVAETLLSYLGPRLKADRLHLAEQLLKFPDGWEADIYRFRLLGDSSLPKPFDSPLTLRVYGGSGAAARARQEFKTMRRVRLLGYPVPRPLLVEEDSRLFGGPFLISEWVPGITLLDRLRQSHTRFLQVPTQLARMHVSLHALSVTGLSPQCGEFLDRHLDEMWAMIDDYELDDLIVGMNWLEEQRPSKHNPPSILHLDFHPANLIVRDAGEIAVLDWSAADIGDRHADVATTLLLLGSAPVTLNTAWEQLLSGPARWILKHRYLRVYRRHYPLDRDLLRYYSAWAALYRLCMYRMWQRASPLANGYKPSSLKYLTPAHLAALRCFFLRMAGVGV